MFKYRNNNYKDLVEIFVVLAKEFEFSFEVYTFIGLLEKKNQENRNLTLKKAFNEISNEIDDKALKDISDIEMNEKFFRKRNKKLYPLNAYWIEKFIEVEYDTKIEIDYFE